MDRSFFLYVQEVTDFLDNVVIKFSPFVDIFNNNPDYLNVAGFNETDPTTYPYYRILTGDTAFATTDMYGYSPATRSEILLTKENVQLYPDIVTFYRETSNLQLLLDRYPNDQFIIRRLINPVTNIQAAIDAKNLTILQTEYDDIYLNEHERSSILIFLQSILWQIDYRWYISPLEFEDLYPYAFWSMLWSVLPLLILTKRIMNIKTIDVHPFHVWEYLRSVGFAGYYGYLSRKQEMFLYRNARYLKFHAGKKFLLSILEEAFLYPLKYNISKRNILCHTYEREATHDKFPDVIPITSLATEYQSSNTFESFIRDIYDDGYDDNNSPEYNTEIANKFIRSPVNKLTTKFLSLDRNIDMFEIMLLIRFVLDQAVYLEHKNRLSFVVNVQNPITQNILQFDNVTDALSLFFYCIYKRNDEPLQPFRYHTLTTALTCDEPPNIPKYIYHSGYKYYVKNYHNVDQLLNEVPYINETVFSSKDLSNGLGDIYSWLFDMINKMKSISETVEHETFNAIMTTLVSPLTVVEFDQQYLTYDEYFDRYPDVKTEMEKVITDDQYSDMMYAIITGICPLEYGFASLARDDEVVSTLIHKIKELFMYMVSYNITFLNPNIEQTINIELPKLVAHIDSNIQDPNWDPDNPTFDEIVGSILFISNNDDQDTFNYRVRVDEKIIDVVDAEKLELDYSMTPSIVNDVLTIQQDDTNCLENKTSSIDDIIYIVSEGVSVTFLGEI